MIIGQYRLPDLDYLQVVLIVGVLVLLYTLFRAQKNNQSFALRDMVVGPDGKVSMTKFAQFGSFLISSWGFIHLVVYNGLTEWYYTAYMVAWTGSQVLSDWIRKKTQSQADQAGEK